MRGDTVLREDVAVYENLTLPLVAGLSYRCSLIATRPEAVARFVARVYSSYQGRTIATEFGFDFELTADWTRELRTLTEVIGTLRSYDLWIELDGVRGWFEWDNVWSYHTGTNYARDARCNDVNNALTKVNYQIEASWEEQFLPAGTGFDSVYPTD